MMQVGYRPQLRMPMASAAASNSSTPVSSFAMPPPPSPGHNMSVPPPNLSSMPPPINMTQLTVQQQMMMGMGEMGFDGKMLRKTVARKTVDHHPSVVKYLEDRVWRKDFYDDRALQADSLYAQLLTLPHHMTDNPASCVMTKFIRAALNKDPRPVFCVCWTPDGRRLITGASSGEFTLWNGLTFNFETILQAHNTAIRTMIWSNNETWMLSGDDKGYIKYWQANMNNVKMVQGHFEAIRGLSFAPTDTKFTSCSDDRTVRIFDFATCTEESVLQGHGSDVKCVDWHPLKAVIISGSKDSQQPIILWDVKSAKKITTIHAHKNTCTDLKWNRFNGNWLVSSSRDHMCKLFDIRNLKEEVQSFRGHKKDACTVAWHPIFEKVFVSGGADGSLYFWHVGAEKEIGSMEDAHDGMIWDMSWHPLGHMLVSGSNDRSTRFWTRNRPGDTVVDKNEEMPSQRLQPSSGIIFKNLDLVAEDENANSDGTILLPGLGLDPELLEALKQEYRSNSPGPSDTYSPRGGHSSHSSQVSSQSQHYRREDAPISRQSDAESKKPVYSKPIPAEFEKAWQSNRPSGPPPPGLAAAGMQLKPPLHINTSQPPPSHIPGASADRISPPSSQQQSSSRPYANSNPRYNQNSNYAKSRIMDLMEANSNSNKRKLSQETNDDFDDRSWQQQQPKSRQFNMQNREQPPHFGGNYKNNDYYQDEANEPPYRPYNNFNRRGGGWGRHGGGGGGGAGTWDN